MEELTTSEKLMAVQLMPEILTATKIMVAAYRDCDLKSHIRFTYQFEDGKYEFTMIKIANEISYKAEI